MKTLKKLDIEKVAKAIEADAGQALPGLRDSLADTCLRPSTVIRYIGCWSACCAQSNNEPLD